MSMLNIDVAIDDERRLVKVELRDDKGAVANTILDAHDLAGLIELLASARANLVDEVPLEIDPGTRLAAVADPAWKIGHAAIPGMKALSLRHPGLGWLSFAIPDHEAQEMAKWLGPDAPQ